MPVKLVEHTYGNHIYMKMRLEDNQVGEIDVYYGPDGSEVYTTSADPWDQKRREQIIAAFNELY